MHNLNGVAAMLEIRIETDNASFEGEAKTAEVARILRAYADMIEGSGFLPTCNLRDVNGNAVGHAVTSKAGTLADLMVNNTLAGMMPK